MAAWRRAAPAPSASFCAIHATAVVHTTPYARPNAKRPASSQPSPGAAWRQHADGHERRGGDRDAARAEAVGDDPRRERDRERRRARRRDQRGRCGGREVVDGGEPRKQRDERRLRELGEQHERVQQGREAAPGPRSVADGERERSHACATIRRMETIAI